MAPGRRETLILVGAGLAAGAAGFLVGPLLLGGGGRSSLPAESMPDLSGKSRQLSEWRGQILVCNFWATWCAPCREEIPVLQAAREKFGGSGVEIVGIAVDNAAKVKLYADNLKISYPILINEATGLDLMRQLGNSSGGLPYTAFFDRQGAVVRHKLGALKADELAGILQSLA